FAGELYESKPAAGEDAKAAFGLVRLSKGDFKLSAKYGNNPRLKQIAFGLVAGESELGKKFRAFEQRSPSLGVHLGLRRDCGTTPTADGATQPALHGELRKADI